MHLHTAEAHKIKRKGTMVYACMHAVRTYTHTLTVICLRRFDFFLYIFQFADSAITYLALFAIIIVAVAVRILFGKVEAMRF